MTWKDFIDGPNGYNASFGSSNNEILCLDGTTMWNVTDADGNKVMMSDIIIPGANYSLKLFN